MDTSNLQPGDSLFRNGEAVMLYNETVLHIPKIDSYSDNVLEHARDDLLALIQANGPVNHLTGALAVVTAEIQKRQG